MDYMVFKNIVEGSKFYVGSMVYTKVARNKAIDANGSEHTFSVYEEVIIEIV